MPPGAARLLCYSTSSHRGAPGSRDSGAWLCSQGMVGSWETHTQPALSGCFPQHLRAGQRTAKSQVSGGWQLPV